MVIETGHQSQWVDQNHIIVQFLLRSLPSDICDILSNTRNATQLYGVINSTYRRQPQIKKRILNVLYHALFFLHHKVQLRGIELYEEETLSEEWTEYLSVPHCLFIALFGKLLNFPAVEESMKRDMQKMLIMAKHVDRMTHLPLHCYSVWQLAQMVMDSRLLTDMTTLERWCCSLAGPHLFSRCKAEMPDLFKKGANLSYHVGTSCHVVVVNQFLGADFRGSAEGDVEAIRGLFPSDKVTLLFNKSVKDLRQYFGNREDQEPSPVSEPSFEFEDAHQVYLWISSHGNKSGSFTCNDGNDMEVVDLVNLILKSATKVENMFVAMQACQGLSLLKGYTGNGNLECDVSQWNDGFPQKMSRKDIDVYMLHVLPGYMAPSLSTPLASGPFPSPLAVPTGCSFMFDEMRKLNRDESEPYQLQTVAGITDMFSKVLSKFKAIEAGPSVFRAVLQHSTSSAL